MVRSARASVAAQGERLSGSFRSPLHDQRTAALLGVALGVSFSVCFLTGLTSHLIQHPPSWFVWPSRPAGLYRVTQSVHVATGFASIPLLLAKLWTVYPQLWTWPPVRGVAHAIERVSVLVLVGGALFMLVTGTQNTARWIPFAFNFTHTHFWVAWITIGALVAHIGAKLAITRAVLPASDPGDPRALRDATTYDGTDRAKLDVAGNGGSGGLSRRGFLVSTAAASGVVTLATVGQTFGPLRSVSVLGPRDPRVGPQGVPINKSAAGAGVVHTARDAGYRLVVEGNVRQRLELTLDDLRALPQREAVLPISCVEGWSAEGRWRGVAVRDLLRLAGAPAHARARVESLQQHSVYRTSPLNRRQTADPDTLLALDLHGAPLHIDHGYPVRLIGPNRPGVQQTKWVSRVVVL